MTTTRKQTEPTEPDDDFAGTQEWTEIDTEFGEKLSWEAGSVFTGEFQRVRTVDLDDGDLAETAEFTAKGDKFYTWMPARLAGAINRALDDGILKAGTTVRIECTGEEPAKRKGMSPSKTFTLRVKAGS